MKNANLNNLLIAKDADNFKVFLNTDEDGVGYVSCGEEVQDVTAEQSEKLVQGDIELLCSLFDYPEFKGPDSVDLWAILDGIMSDDEDNRSHNLNDPHAVIGYAESCGEDITLTHAEKIISVAKKWLNDIENGNGEYSRMRNEAKTALES